MSNQKAAINGAKWTTTATVITTVLSFLQLSIIARVLEPSAFGLVSICSLVLNFFHIFANLGFSNSIISKQETDRRILSTIFFASVALGLIMGVLIYFSSPFVVAFYKEVRLEHVVKVSAFTFPLVYTSQIYWILLQKELRFKTLAFIEVAYSVVSIVTTIILAYNNYQEMSLIYGQLIATIVKTFLYIMCGRDMFQPVWYFKLKEIKDHLRFGIFYLGEGILGFVSGNLENIVIGKVISVTALGYYTIAYQLAVFPIYKLNPIIMQVSYPIMAKIKDDAGLKRAYLKIVDFITCCNFPLLAGLLITAAGVVPIVYGPGWETSIPLVRIILSVSFLACIVAPVSSLALSKGRPNYMFYLNSTLLLIKLPVLYVAAKYYGLTGIAMGFVIMSLVETVISFFIVRHLVGNILPEFFRNIYKPVLFCLIMIAAIAVYQYFVGGIGLLNMIIQIAIGGLVYITLALKYKISWKEILALKQSL